MYFLLSLLLCNTLVSATMFSRTQVLMGTFATINIPKQNAKELQESFLLIKKIQKSLSSYDKNATIYQLNHARKVSLDSYTYEALKLSYHYYQVSQGNFNIAIGAITKGLFHFGEAEQLPKKEQLLRTNTSIHAIYFNKKKAWLEQGVQLDLGGMGKGFAVDKAAAYLHAHNITQGSIALSGDIRCLGICYMAIQNPFGEGVITTFTSKYPNIAISTSGNYRRYVQSKKNNHLINPKTKTSQHTFASITLFSYGSNSDIDAYATASSVMSIKKARIFLDSLGVAYILITTDAKEYRSKNLASFIKCQEK